MESQSRLVFCCLFLLSLVGAQNGDCNEGYSGDFCEYVLQGNCMVSVLDPSAQLFCLEFSYSDCIDTINVSILEAIPNNSTSIGELNHAGSAYHIILPDWEGQRDCKNPIGVTSYNATVEGNCFEITSVFVPEEGIMEVCGTFNEGEFSRQFPFSFCQTFSYSLCGTSNYFYPPCESNYASEVIWDPQFLADPSEFITEEESYSILYPQSLCMEIQNVNNATKILECASLRVDTCTSTVIFVAVGLIDFVTEVQGESSFCFGYHQESYFCNEIQSYHYDRQLQEFIGEMTLSFHSPYADPLFVSFDEFSLHYPSCGAMHCTPGQHVPLHWEAPIITDDIYDYINESTDELVEASSGKSEKQTSGGKTSPRKTNTALVWCLSTILPISFIMVTVAAIGLVVLSRQKMRKKTNFLLAESKEVLIELEDASTFDSTRRPRSSLFDEEEVFLHSK